MMLKKLKIWFKIHPRTDLANAYLRGADLSGAKLEGANLNGANLNGADLRGADLSGAKLERANLRDANLSRANLYVANLRGASLEGAELRNADLRNANLRGANLRGASLKGAELRNADLRGADLRGANLYNAFLHNANLEGITSNEGTLFFELSCPEEGEFIGWKKVRNNDEIFLVKLLIPEDAKRSSATSYKCRCSYAKVIDITNIEETEHYKAIRNTNFSPQTKYIVGEYVYPDSFDENRWNECSHGIHFFINKANAINY